MKIQNVSNETRPKVYALLQRAFPGSVYEAELVKALHANGRLLHEWVAIQAGRVIAYLAFSTAYRDGAPCGLHLAPMAVTPDFQGQGVGGELLRFALRQPVIAGEALYVLGEPAYYQRFGFSPLPRPACPFDPGNRHFLGLRAASDSDFVIGYEAEFTSVAATPRRPAAKNPRRR